MKKIAFGAILGLFVVAISSCGHTVCDAYGGQADYSKYKTDHNKKIEMIQALTEAM
jgi:hypothetical protein